MARIRNVLSIGLTAFALLIIATARAPDPATPTSIAAVRVGPAPAAAPPSRAWAIRLGLATLLLTGLAIRLREGT